MRASRRRCPRSHGRSRRAWNRPQFHRGRTTILAGPSRRFRRGLIRRCRASRGRKRRGASRRDARRQSAVIGSTTLAAAVLGAHRRIIRTEPRIRTIRRLGVHQHIQRAAIGDTALAVAVRSARRCVMWVASQSRPSSRGRSRRPTRTTLSLAPSTLWADPPSRPSHQLGSGIAPS